MPPRNPASAAAPALATPVAAAPSPAAQQPAPVRQAAYPAPRVIVPPVAGLPARPPGDDSDDAGNFDFADLPAGDYVFLAYVDQVVMWPSGAGVGFKCICEVLADGSMNRNGVYGREFKWDQTPPPFAVPDPDDEKKMANFRRWRSDLVKNYIALGHPEVTTGDAEGWDKDAAGNTVPPYYKFFADQIGSIFVPIVIRLAVHVDQGYEGYPKIRKATKEVRGDSYILAPKPRKLAQWIAEANGWFGTPDIMTIKKTGAEVHCVKDIKGIETPDGMPTHKDLR